MNPKPLILCIDDDRTIRRLLKAILVASGYEAMEADQGRSGLELARQKVPDLILLDVMMPEMSGYEVIQELKASPITTEIPVIFLSAMSEASNKAKGLELGAADFVNKPFDRAELLARIKTQLKLRQQEAALKEYSQNLEKMVQERTEQLIHADRLASLGAMSAGVAHEVNNPTTFIMGNVQTVELFWRTVAEHLTNSQQSLKDPKIQYVLKEFPAIIQSIRYGAERIAKIVAGLKSYARKEIVHKTLVDLHECIENSLQLTNANLKNRVKVVKNFAADLPPVWADGQQLVQVFVNLLVNSADAIGDHEGLVSITTRLTPDHTLLVEFSDNGPGIPPEIMGKIFNPFFTTKPIGVGTGLGLSIIQGIIEDHGGTIEVISEPGSGTTFLITLQMEKKP
ncbi:MAG: response regulator [Deltaproteobacteria bacterium]|nr:response regulator [Deltaproteobacteria bacterium]